MRHILFVSVYISVLVSGLAPDGTVRSIVGDGGIMVVRW
jgi:hypothetical protein